MKIKISKRKAKRIKVIVSICISLAIIVPTGMVLKDNYQRFSAKNPILLSDYFVKTTDRAKIHLIAHRGLSCQAPENTVPAIEKAAEYGFDSVEIDIRQTQDGVWVLSHDEKVTETTNKRGKISSYTYYDLVTCKINRGANHKKYENLTIPTLEQALATCLEYNIKPMIEIKDYTEKGIEKLVKIIDENGFTSSCTVISFDRNALKLVRENNSEIQITALVSKLTKEEIATCLNDTTIGLSFNGNSSTATKENIKKLQDAGVSLYSWTIDDGEKMQELYSYGITEFVTNIFFE